MFQSPCIIGYYLTPMPQNVLVCVNWNVQRVDRPWTKGTWLMTLLLDVWDKVCFPFFVVVGRSPCRRPKRRSVYFKYKGHLDTIFSPLLYLEVELLRCLSHSCCMYSSKLLKQCVMRPVTSGSHEVVKIVLTQILLWVMSRKQTMLVLLDRNFWNPISVIHVDCLQARE